MTKKETVAKNIELTFDFVRQIIDNPKLADNLPAKCEIEFIERDYSSQTEHDLKNKQLIKVEHNFTFFNGAKISKPAGLKA